MGCYAAGALKSPVGERLGAATLLQDKSEISHIRVRRRSRLVSQHLPKQLLMITIGTRSAYAHLGQGSAQRRCRKKWDGKIPHQVCKGNWAQLIFRIHREEFNSLSLSDTTL